MKTDPILNNPYFSWPFGALLSSLILKADSFPDGNLNLLDASQMLLVVHNCAYFPVKAPFRDLALALPVHKMLSVSARGDTGSLAFSPQWVSFSLTHSFHSFRSALFSFLPPCKSLLLFLAKTSAFPLNLTLRCRASLKSFVEIFPLECSHDFQQLNECFLFWICLGGQGTAYESR